MQAFGGQLRVTGVVDDFLPCLSGAWRIPKCFFFELFNWGASGSASM